MMPNYESIAFILIAIVAGGIIAKTVLALIDEIITEIENAKYEREEARRKRDNEALQSK